MPLYDPERQHGPADEPDLCDVCGLTEEQCNESFHKGLGMQCENAVCPDCLAREAKGDGLCGECHANVIDLEIDRQREAV